MGAYVSVGGIISNSTRSPSLQMITYPSSLRRSNARHFTLWTWTAQCRMQLTPSHIASLVASSTANSKQIQMLLALGWVITLSIPAYPAIKCDGQILYAFFSVAALALLTSLIYLVLQTTTFMSFTGLYSWMDQPGRYVLTSIGTLDNPNRLCNQCAGPSLL